MAKIEYTVTQDDLNIIKRDLATNRTLKHLKDLSFYKFSVGDVLVREDRGYDKQWNVHTAACGLPYRYMYVFENELGVGYIRRLSVKGDHFVEFPICTVDFDPETTRFKVDPSYADQLLIGEDAGFDPKGDYKAARKKKEAVYRANDKLREKLDTEAEVLAFLKKLKVGDQIWHGWSKSNINKEPYVVADIHFGTQDTEQAAQEEKQRSGTWSWRTPVVKYDTTCLSLSDPRWPKSDPRQYTISNLQYGLWFTVKPNFVDDVL